MTAMCPRCRELRNLQTTVTKWVSKERDSRIRMRTESHHCEECGVFVSSEDSEETARHDTETHQDDNRNNPDDPPQGPGDGSPVVPSRPRPSPLEQVAEEIRGPGKI
jgi:hypothetical protein